MGIAIPGHLVDGIGVGEGLHDLGLCDAREDRTILIVFALQDLLQLLSGDAVDCHRRFELDRVALETAAGEAFEGLLIDEGAGLEVYFTSLEHGGDKMIEDDGANMRDRIELVEVVIDVVVTGAEDTVRADTVVEDVVGDTRRDASASDASDGGVALVDPVEDFRKLTGGEFTVGFGARATERVVGTVFGAVDGTAGEEGEGQGTGSEDGGEGGTIQHEEDLCLGEALFP